jgi:hypothetical protein
VRGCGVDVRGAPWPLPAPAFDLRGFHVVGLAVRYPFRAALQVGAQEVADAVCISEAVDVYGERGEHLQDAVEQDPPAEAGIARGGFLKV